MVKFRRFTKTVNKMAICGTCNSEVPRNMRKKIDRTVSGVSLRRLLSEYFDFSPLNPTVCRQCNITLEQIVRINVKLEKLTIQRNSIITDFNAKLSESKNIPESAEIPVPQSDENQNVTTGDVTGGQNHQVFAEVKIEPEDDTAVYRDKDFSSAQTASATIVRGMCERRQERYTEYHGTVRTETTEYTGYLSASSSTTTAIQTVVNNDMGPLPQEPSAHTTPSAPGVDSKTTDTLPLPAVADDNHMDTHPLVQDQQSDESDTLLPVQGDQSDNDSDTLLPVQGDQSDNDSDTLLPVQGDQSDNDSDTLFPVQGDQSDNDSDTLFPVQGDQSNNASNTAPPSPRELPATAAVPTVSVNNRLVKLKPADEKGMLQKRRESALKINNNPKPFQCGMCSLDFSVSVCLKKHMKTHGRRSPKLVRCGKCLKTFSCTSALVSHMKVHLDQQCTMCLERFADAGLFRAHLKAHEKCGKSKSAKMYLCEWCSKMFSAKSCFRIHTRQHTGEEPFMCDFCPARFKQAPNLKRHLRVHTGERPYKCQKCSKTFKGHTGLNMHMLIHKGEKTVKCVECPAAFVSMIGLKAHMRCAHSDARPYACRQCEAAFKTSFHLKRHQFLHTGEKPFKCDQCSATFIQNGNMKIHMKVHNKSNRRSNLPTSCMVNQVPPAATVNLSVSETANNCCSPPGPSGEFVVPEYFPRVYTMTPPHPSSHQ